jgi:hypothetical protein
VEQAGEGYDENHPEGRAMPVESPQSIDFQAQRAELEAVLQSKSFTRAPRLAHLLSYLCERLFAGDACRIKEYSIGVEVFLRGSSFDQDADSIVRVEANRLRKRLAEYYAGEGASHRLQITIPVGQYVPEFKCVEPRQEAVVAEMATTPGGIEEAPRRPWERWIRLRDHRVWWVGAALVVVGLTFAGLRYRHFSLQLEQRAPAAVSNQTEGLFADSQVGPPMGEEVRVLAGSSRSHVDHAGRLWSADAWFSGGSAVKSAVQHIWRTQEQGFYRSSRQGQFRYDIPLKKGIYELHLHFAETVYDPESTWAGGEGNRIMTVRANGKTLLSRFDVVTDAGASRTADVKVFPDITPAADGLLHLEFSGEGGNQAILSAIEILPGVKGHIRPVRVLARQTPYYSNDSRWWSPDVYFEGGQMAAYSAPVGGTDDPELFESERWGNFSYAIPVSPGRYSVSLYFAARHGEGEQRSPSSSDGKSATAHVFNVFCNGKALLQNFDLLKEAREKEAVIKKVAGLEPNAQGKLLLSFVPVEGYATVAGIEVVPE